MSLRRSIGRRRFLAGAASTAGLWALPLGWGCAASGWSATEDPGALARAHRWLWNAQTPDGRFASATYGLLASGQSLTPFVLDSLLVAPQPLLVPASPAVVRAFEAMRQMRDGQGALGLSGPSLDYPCYATGLMLSCLGAARPEGWRASADPSIAWLRGQQFRARDGWQGHPAQGGWGMGDRGVRRPPHAGHVDLSMTRRVLDGLCAVDVPADDPAIVEARDFVARCQTADGSFVYSPVELALNKGLRGPDGSPKGYGSATTDGLLCLQALDRGRSEAAERAADWLRANHRVDRNPGLDGGPMELFAEAMRGYYRAGAAHCFARVGGPPGWQRALAEAIESEQRADGSFVGTNGLQKEDDPIVGTAFAAQALAFAGWGG